MSNKGKKYGTEYKTLAQFGNVKVVKYLNGNTTAPMETMNRGRIYATVDAGNDIKYISFYDSENERSKQIDVKGRKHSGMLPHTHLGYEHDEYGTRALNDKENKIVDYILASWERKREKIKL